MRLLTRGRRRYADLRPDVTVEDHMTSYLFQDHGSLFFPAASLHVVFCLFRPAIFFLRVFLFKDSECLGPESRFKIGGLVSQMLGPQKYSGLSHGVQESNDCSDQLHLDIGEAFFMKGTEQIAEFYRNDDRSPSPPPPPPRL